MTKVTKVTGLVLFLGILITTFLLSGNITVYVDNPGFLIVLGGGIGLTMISYILMRLY